MSDLQQRIANLSPEKRALLLRKLGMTGDRIAPVAQREIQPLSFTQQRLWFLARLEPDSDLYNAHLAQRLLGELDVSALEQSLNRLVGRHETLRTVFRAEEGTPWAAIVAPAPFALALDDVSMLPEVAREEAARRLIDEEACRPFDLSQGPLLRARLIRLADQEHILQLTMHHIVSDAWSMGVLKRELSTLYNALKAGNEPQLPELPIQYADYAAWQRQWLQGERMERQLDYWKRQLDGVPELKLPLDHPDREASGREARLEFLLPTRLTQALSSLGRQHNATLFMVTLAAFQLLLHRHSGEEDIVVGSPIAGRNRSETAGLLGCFINTLLMRADLSGDPSYLELLVRVRDTALQAYANQDLPFEKLVSELAPQRRLGRNPLFEVLFVFQNVPDQGLRMDGVEAQPLLAGSRTAKLDLSLVLTETRDGMQGLIEYNADLFDATTMHRLCGHFRTLLEGIVSTPHARLSELPLLTPEERRQLLIEWNDAFRGPAGDRCMHQMFEAQAAKTPGSPALLHQDGQLDYAGLDARANRLAHYLRSLGVVEEACVGICLERGFDLVTAMLAVWKAGAAWVPLSPGLPQERLAYMLEDSAARVVLTHSHLLPRLPHAEAGYVSMDRAWETIAQLPEQPPATAVGPGNLAYVIYTSGSTGTPKGVAVEHASVAHHCQVVREHYRLVAGDRLLQFAASSFDVCIEELFPGLLAGAAVALSRHNQNDPAEMDMEVKRYGVTVLNLPPAFLWQWLQLDHGTRPLPEMLRLLISGGDRLSRQTVAAWQSRGHPAVLLNAYGPTETTITATLYPVPDALPDGEGVPIGRPLSGTRAYILDRRRQPVPVGVEGELFIGGYRVARGYLNNPALTAEKFVADPFSAQAGARLYRSGDRARYRADGNIEFVGRIDDQVKIRGYRIEPGEIEAALLQHDTVGEALVVAREDKSGELRLVAYFVLAPGCEVTPLSLRTHLQAKLPEYMVPAAYVRLEAMPLNRNGKLDRRALPEPDAHALARTQDFSAPTRPLERELQAIWMEVLGVARIGIHDDFFELGGHSMLAASVVAKIHDAIDSRLPMRALFEFPTIAQLATQIDEQASGNSGQPVPQRSAGTLTWPLSFAQQRLWLIDQLEPDSGLYNIAMAVRLKGMLNMRALERSLDALVQRHEALRTVFQMEGGEPVQVVEPHAQQVLPLLDLSAADPGKVQRQLELEANAPFDLVHGPLFRFRLLKQGEREHVLQVTMHHIVSDGWSMGVLKHELSVLYQAFNAGQPSPLVPLPIQYGDFAIWQRQWLSGEELLRQTAYWKQQLSGLAVLELPTDRARPAVQSHRGASVAVELPEALTQALIRLGRNEKATLFMTLLSAFQVLLQRHAGQAEITVGVPIAGRNRIDTAGLIGFFVNTLVMRGDLSGDPTFQGLLGRTRNMALDAYTHQDMPFEKLVTELAPKRDLSHHPLFQVMFALQNTPDAGLALDGLEVTPVRMAGSNAKFDLTLMLTEVDGGLHGVFEYSTDLFDAATVERMAVHFHKLLDGIAANPQARLSELPLLDDAERRQLLVDWNDTLRDYPKHLCVHQLFEAQAAKTPHAEALLHEGRRLTYAELDVRANRLALDLRGLGVGAETRVAICMDRCFELVVGLLGILKAGGAYVPLDPEYPRERLEFMLADTAAPLMLTLERHRAGLPAFNGRIMSLDSDREMLPPAQGGPDSHADPRSLAYVIYTSGSTGQPKGVMVEHRSIVRLLFGVDYVRLGAETSLLAMAPVAFDASTFEIWGALLHGGRCVLYPDNRPSLEGIGRIMREQRIDTLFMTTALFNAAIDEVPESLRGVGQLLFGGEKASLPHVQRALERLPDTRLIHVYGPTESTTFACSHELPRGANHTLHTVPIGRPIGNTTAHVLDSWFNPAPVGVAGELYIGGDGVARGHLNNAALSAEKFVANPFSAEAGARLYRTGDRVRWLADGNIDFLGRMDEQVKIRGFRIEPGEVEAALLRHPAVLNAVVQAREDEGGGRQLVAFIHKAPERELTREFLAQSLPAYIIPGRMFLMSRLPLNASGKVDRALLQNTLLPRQGGQSQRQMPYDTLQATLVELWSGLLELPQQEIGIDENFFELGGDSLKAVVLQAKIEKLMRWSIPLAEIYNHPTVEGLAHAMLQYRGKTTSSPLVEIQAGSAELPPFFFLHGDFHGGGYFCHQVARLMGPEQTVYALQPHGLPGRAMLPTIEAMAAEYVELIRAACPQGPYFIGGHCNGAMVAFEVAQRLLALGQKVGLLAMMDPSPVSVQPLDGPAAELDRQVTAADLDKMEPVMRHNEVMRLYGLVIQRYRPRQYPDKLTLILAQGNVKEADPTSGWRNAAKDGEILVVPGNHVSMLTLHMPALARMLVEARNRAWAKLQEG